MFEELFAKFNFWRAKKFLTLDKDYEFMLDLSDNNAMAVRIIKKYPGVIVEYTNIHMSSDNQMSYDINVIANPNLCKVTNSKFNDFTTMIFRSIILGSVDYAKEQHENGKLDSVEFDEERDIHEEGTSVPEERVPERKPRKKGVRGNKAVRSKVQYSPTNRCS